MLPVTTLAFGGPLRPYSTLNAGGFRVYQSARYRPSGNEIRIKSLE